MNISLKQRVLEAGIWSLAGFAISLGVRFGSSLFMARMLMPEMFGVISIAWAIMVGLAMFTDVGLQQNIVQSARGSDPAFLNTAWVIQIVRGLLLSVIGICIGFLLLLIPERYGIASDSAYADTSLPYVIMVISLSAAIGGFESTKLFEANRNLRLGPITWIEISAQIAGLLSMAAWVTFDRSIWALVAGGICSSFVRTILSHTWLNGASNHWEFQSSASAEILHFGKWIFLSSIIGFLVNNGDRLLLGGLVNSTLLGFYSIALLFVSAIEGILTRIMSDVAFPAFSEVARLRPSSLREIYYRFSIIISFISYFMSGLLMTFGNSLIDLLYDSRYQGSGWILEILSAILLTMPFRLATQSFLALGMPRLQTNTVIIRLVVLFVLTPIGFYHMGMSGALYSIVLSQFSSVPLIVFYNISYKLFDLRRELLFLGFFPLGLAAGKFTAFVLQ